jgi:hypothetical protein
VTDDAEFPCGVFIVAVVAAIKLKNARGKFFIPREPIYRRLSAAVRDSIPETAN